MKTLSRIFCMLLTLVMLLGSTAALAEEAVATDLVMQTLTLNET